MPFAVLADNTGTYTADHDERDRLSAIHDQLSAAKRQIDAIRPPDAVEEQKPYADRSSLWFASGSIDDALSYISGEIGRLTDQIGDEVNYGGRPA